MEVLRDGKIGREVVKVGMPGVEIVELRIIDGKDVCLTRVCFEDRAEFFLEMSSGGLGCVAWEFELIPGSRFRRCHGPGDGEIILGNVDVDIAVAVNSIRF